MEHAGVAKRLDKPIWMTKDGVEYNINDAYGFKVTHRIIRPEMCLCGDEVGGIYVWLETDMLVENYS